MPEGEFPRPLMRTRFPDADDINHSARTATHRLLAWSTALWNMISVGLVGICGQKLMAFDLFFFFLNTKADK